MLITCTHNAILFHDSNPFHTKYKTRQKFSAIFPRPQPSARPNPSRRNPPVNCTVQRRFNINNHKSPTLNVLGFIWLPGQDSNLGLTQRVKRAEVNLPSLNEGCKLIT